MMTDKQYAKHLENVSKRSLNMTPGNLIDNYIYLYHVPGEENPGLGDFVILPTYPDNFTDTLQSQFGLQNILARSAPIFSYSYSGPRSITLTLSLHRDMMQQLNYGVSNLKLKLGDDYVDTLIDKLQAIALPNYDHGNKMVNPPMIAVRFGNQLFIKGVVTGGINTSYTLPLLPNGKYAQVSLNFTVCEVDPYDAETVITQGALRGLSTTLERNLYK